MRPKGPLRGSAVPPGDKSISHRAFLLNCLGTGAARVSGSNEGLDLGSTRSVLAQLGVVLRESAAGYLVEGRAGRLRPASDALNCGNSGTTMRLLAGILAAQPFTTTLSGDESLQRRPMTRIADPLRQMGARVEGRNGGRTPPLIVSGCRLRSQRFRLPVASAQVKSCLLLAAAASRVEVEIEEAAPTRDHTEKMLAAMGAQIECEGTRVHLRESGELQCVDVSVPKDPSAAALIFAAAATVPQSRVAIEGVSLNPRRSAFLEVYRRMGIDIQREHSGTSAGEERGDLLLQSPSALRPLQLGADEVPGLIDEIPALAVLCAFAPGRSRLSGLRELRVKESDRLAAIARLLQDFAVEAAIEGDTLSIVGGEVHAPKRYQPARDHRMVMAAAALAVGALSRAEDGQCELMESDEVAVSDPEFFSTLRKLSGAS